MHFMTATFYTVEQETPKDIAKQLYALIDDNDRDGLEKFVLANINTYADLLTCRFDNSNEEIQTPLLHALKQTMADTEDSKNPHDPNSRAAIIKDLLAYGASLTTVPPDKNLSNQLLYYTVDLMDVKKKNELVEFTVRYSINGKSTILTAYSCTPPILRMLLKYNPYIKLSFNKTAPEDLIKETLPVVLSSRYKILHNELCSTDISDPRHSIPEDVQNKFTNQNLLGLIKNYYMIGEPTLQNFLCDHTISNTVLPKHNITALTPRNVLLTTFSKHMRKDGKLQPGIKGSDFTQAIIDVFNEFSHNDVKSLNLAERGAIEAQVKEVVKNREEGSLTVAVIKNIARELLLSVNRKPKALMPF